MWTWLKQQLGIGEASPQAGSFDYTENFESPEEIDLEALDAQAADALLQQEKQVLTKAPLPEEPAVSEAPQPTSAVSSPEVLPAAQELLPSATVITSSDTLPVSHARLSGSAFTMTASPAQDSPRHPLEGSLIAPTTFSVHSDRVSIGGVWLDELAKTYGTPLYIVDGTTLRQAARDYKETLEQAYKGKHLVVYACKANMNMGLVKLLESEGFGLDVVSAGELNTALKAGFPLERIIMNGNNKSSQDIAMALEANINRILVDNASELEVIAEQARRLETKAKILLRVTPGLECHTHDYIKTGQNDSKFGFSLEQLSAIIHTIQNDYQDTLELKGLQAHIGSQIFELQAYEDLVKILLNIVYNVKQAYGLELEDLDVGGGLGIAYTDADDPRPIPTLVQQVAETLEHYANKLELPLPRLMMEPGRSLIARAGVTLYSVGSRKDLEGYPSYIAVDGGMGDNIRPALYQAEYTAMVANKPMAAPEETVRLVGKYCESGDILLKAFETPKLERGDLVMLFSTGGYNASMASNYNRFPRPAMVLVEEGKSALLMKRESLDDLLLQDMIPEWLL